MRPTRHSARKIPGFVPGIFFFAWAIAAAAPPAWQLAEELFAEGHWQAARLEARRVQAIAAPRDAARARLLAAVAALRLGEDQPAALHELESLWREEAVELELRAWAAYEFGRASRWGGGTNAAAALEFAYLHARQPPLFWRAGCTLYFHLKAHKRLRREKAALWQSLQSCRDAWPLEIWRECRPRRPAGQPLAARPARWLVKLYRSQIGPALGSRCDLEPSCSEYFLQATRAHGWLGLPIMADRFVREPAVVALKENPVTLPSGRIRYADPLAAHDLWLKGQRH